MNKIMELNNTRIDFPAMKMLIDNVAFKDLVSLHSMLEDKISNYRTGNLEEDFEIVSRYGKNEPYILDSNKFKFTRLMIDIITSQLDEWNRHQIYTIEEVICFIEESLYYNEMEYDLSNGINDKYSEYVDDYYASRENDDWLEGKMEVGSLPYRFYTATCRLYKDEDLNAIDIVDLVRYIKINIMLESVENNVSSFTYDW